MKKLLNILIWGVLPLISIADSAEMMAPLSIASSSGSIMTKEIANSTSEDLYSESINIVHDSVTMVLEGLDGQWIADTFCNSFPESIKTIVLKVKNSDLYIYLRKIISIRIFENIKSFTCETTCSNDKKDENDIFEILEAIHELSMEHLEYLSINISMDIAEKVFKIMNNNFYYIKNIYFKYPKSYDSKNLDEILKKLSDNANVPDHIVVVKQVVKSEPDRFYGWLDIYKNPSPKLTQINFISGYLFNEMSWIVFTPSDCIE